MDEKLIGGNILLPVKEFLRAETTRRPGNIYIEHGEAVRQMETNW